MLPYKSVNNAPHLGWSRTPQGRLYKALIDVRLQATLLGLLSARMCLPAILEREMSGPYIFVEQTRCIQFALLRLR